MSDSSSVIDLVTATSTAPSTYTHAEHPSSPVSAKTKDDAVTLSPAAQVVLLNQQGLSVAEISQVLTLPVSSVQEQLGIAIASTQTKAVAA